VSLATSPADDPSCRPAQRSARAPGIHRYLHGRLGAVRDQQRGPAWWGSPEPRQHLAKRTSV